MKPSLKRQRMLWLLFLLSFVQSVAQAQTEKGRWTAGVNIGSFTFRKNNSTINLAPAAGYFVAPNFVVGTGVPIIINRSDEGSDFYRSSAIGIAPFVRYYIGQSRLKPYLSFSYSYSFVRQRYNFTGALPVPDEKGHNRDTSPSIGLAYFINRNVALNADLSHHWSKSNAIFAVGDRNNYTSLVFGFQIFFGK